MILYLSVFIRGQGGPNQKYPGATFLVVSPSPPYGDIANKSAPVPSGLGTPQAITYKINVRIASKKSK